MDQAATTEEAAAPSLEQDWSRAEALLRAGDRDAALVVLLGLCGRFPDHAPAFIRAGEVLLSLGQPLQAEPLLREAAARLPTEPWLLRAHAHAIRAANHPGAENGFRLVAESFPDFGPGRADWAAYILHTRRDPVAAEAELGRAMQAVPDYAWLMDVQAECAERRDDWAVAVERWHALRIWHPSHDRAYAREALALLHLGQVATAERTARAGLELFPAAPPLLRALAEAAMARESWSEAAAFWADARQRRPADANTLILEAASLARLDQPTALAEIMTLGTATYSDWADRVTTWADRLADAAAAARLRAALPARSSGPVIAPPPAQPDSLPAPVGTTPPAPPAKEPASAAPPTAELPAALVQLWANDFPAFLKTVEAAPAEPIHPIAIRQSPPADRLRVAVLVTGHLGGFREARKTWPLLRLGTADTRVFVHAWRGDATEAEVAEVFGAASVELEDLGSSAAAHLATEAARDRHSVRAAWRQMAASGTPFDLVIRLRPHLTTFGIQDLDWRRILTRSVAGRVILADAGKAIADGKPSIGVRFAAGATALMEAYADLGDEASDIAESLVRAAIDVQPMPDMLFAA